jgi:hypothetical protein
MPKKKGALNRKKVKKIPLKKKDGGGATGGPMANKKTKKKRCT